jgi:pyruvate/2-oxoglutarate dehydrogenase complex dihydrolipoamide acyltransferase (E2) component
VSSSRTRAEEGGPVKAGGTKADDVKPPDRMSGGGNPLAQALVDVTMPQMGVSVAEGTIVGWCAQVGDRIEADATIAEISTDKIDTEVPAPVTGVVAEILVAVEETVPVGTVLARIAPAGGGTTDAAAGGGTAAPAGSGTTAESLDGGTGDGAAAHPFDGGTTGPSTTETPSPRPDKEAAAPDSLRPRAAGAGNGHGRYSPVVQRIAAEHGVDLAQVPGTGRGGRVRKQDVLSFLESTPVEEPPLHIESPYRPEPVPAPAAAVPVRGPGGLDVTAPAPGIVPETGGQLSRIRRQIGEHMKRSLETTATCTTWIEADMSRVEAARARLGVTGLAFVARATIDALREYPAVNAWLEGERYTQPSDVNLGIAVSLGEDGLIVPVIPKAHELSVEGLAARIKDLARRARARELTPDDVRGGTFTITNPGQYGSIMATPIINLPQVAILDFEAVIKRPVVVTDADGNDSIAIRPITILGLSWDHRALDGALAAQFLAAVKRRLESVS